MVLPTVCWGINFVTYQFQLYPEAGRVAEEPHQQFICARPIGEHCNSGDDSQCKLLPRAVWLPQRMVV